MIIYSVTVTIDAEVESAWLPWMHRQHIPDVMATGYFTSVQFTRLLEPEPEEGTATFNIQYACDSLERYVMYRELESPRLQAEHTERFKDRFVAFRTILEVL